MPEKEQNHQKSVFEMDISPFRILLWNALAAIFFQLVVYWAASGNHIHFLPRTHYTIVLGFLMVFAMFTAVLSVSSHKPDAYWWKSLVSYALLSVSTGFTAYLFSGLTPDEAGPFRWMFFVFTFGFVFLLAIFRVIKWLVKLAQKMDSRLPK